MCNADYKYFTNKSGYSNWPTQDSFIPVSVLDISKYAIMNGCYGRKSISYDAEKFYESSCKMALNLGTEVFTLSDDYKEAETSYKVSISFAMGMLATRIVAAKVYNVTRLYHFTDHNFSSTLNQGKVAPDWFGFNQNGDPFLFESKGTTGKRISKKAIDHAEEQLNNVKSVKDESTGQIYDKCKIQKHIIGSCFNTHKTHKTQNTYIANAWQIHDVDPEESGKLELTINIDKECFWYYRTFIMNIMVLSDYRNSPRHITIGNKSYCCWTYESKIYHIPEKIYYMAMSDNYTESNKYQYFTSRVNEELYSMDYWKKFSQDEISTYEDGIIVCNSNFQR